MNLYKLYNKKVFELMITRDIRLLNVYKHTNKLLKDNDYQLVYADKINSPFEFKYIGNDKDKDYIIIDWNPFDRYISIFKHSEDQKYVHDKSLAEIKWLWIYLNLKVNNNLLQKFLYDII